MKLSNGVIIDDTLFSMSHRNSGQMVALDPLTGTVPSRGCQATGSC
jgi:hypothetical protein